MTQGTRTQAALWQHHYNYEWLSGKNLHIKLIRGGPWRGSPLKRESPTSKQADVKVPDAFMLITRPYYHHSQSSYLSNTLVALFSCFVASTSVHFSQTYTLWLDPSPRQLGNKITLTGSGYPCCKLVFIDSSLCAVGAYHPSATLGAQQGVEGGVVWGGVGGVRTSVCASSLFTWLCYGVRMGVSLCTITLLFSNCLSFLHPLRGYSRPERLRVSQGSCGSPHSKAIKNLQKHLDPGKGVSFYTWHDGITYGYECEICVH